MTESGHGGVGLLSGHVLVLDGEAEADRELVGNKGASIAHMLRLGLPVPPAFALPIGECRRYHRAGRLQDDVWHAVLEGIADLERRTARRLGDPAAPLLVSVRSGAAISMPGMMDTILNLGMTDAVRAGLAALSGAPDFARAVHVRFLHEYGHIVLGADLEEPAADADPGAVARAIADDTGEAVPEDPVDQLRGAIQAVFDSWTSRRAVAYRRHWGIAEDGGTAVIVQAMVFGNLGEDSGTGVLFTRNPLSGERTPYGEWLPGGQGEDVVSGTHDCLDLAALGEQLPHVHAELLDAAGVLEREARDVQDIEFTVQQGRLYLLQTRVAKRSPAAAVRIAAELFAEGAIDLDAALRRITPEQLTVVLAPRLARGVADAAQVLARGVPACPGVASGRAVADSEAAERAAAAGGEVVLCRPTTSPEDVHGMFAAQAVVTEHGGATSHAAVVSRALGRPSVVGVGGGATAGWDGREVTVDGSAGVVYAGRLPTEAVDVDGVPGLSGLIDHARRRSPVAVAEEPDGDVLDLEHFDPNDLDAAALEAVLRSAGCARGAVLATAAGAAAAVRAGLRCAVPVPGQHPAVLLLRLVQAGSPNEEEQ